MSNFKATERIDGFIFVRDIATGSLVGAVNRDGVLKPKRFKSTTRVASFIYGLTKVANASGTNDVVEVVAEGSVETD